MVEFIVSYIEFSGYATISLVECSTVILVWCDGIPHLTLLKNYATRLNRSCKNSNDTSSIENKAQLRAVIKNKFHKGICFLTRAVF
jgi:hypothetical protein